MIFIFHPEFEVTVWRKGSGNKSAGDIKGNGTKKWCDVSSLAPSFLICNTSVNVTGKVSYVVCRMA